MHTGFLYVRTDTASNSFFITGLTFHIVSVFASEGFPKADAIAIFLPTSVVAVSISLVFNWLSDYIHFKWYLYPMILGEIMSSIGFLFLSSPFGVPLIDGGFVIISGFFAVLNAIVWSHFYGRIHLGAITGKSMSFLILASALAPQFSASVFRSLGRIVCWATMGRTFCSSWPWLR